MAKKYKVLYSLDFREKIGFETGDYYRDMAMEILMGMKSPKAIKSAYAWVRACQMNELEDIAKAEAMQGEAQP